MHTWTSSARTSNKSKCVRTARTPAQGNPNEHIRGYVDSSIAGQARIDYRGDVVLPAHLTLESLRKLLLEFQKLKRTRIRLDLNAAEVEGGGVSQCRDKTYTYLCWGLLGEGLGVGVGGVIENSTGFLSCFDLISIRPAGKLTHGDLQRRVN